VLDAEERSLMFTASIWSRLASVSRSIGSRMWSPALLTSTSSRPAVLRISQSPIPSRTLAPRRAGETRLVRLRPAPRPAPQPDAPLPRRASGKKNRGTLGDEAARYCLPDPPGRSGDERDLARKPHPAPPIALYDVSRPPVVNYRAEAAVPLASSRLSFVPLTRQLTFYRAS